MAFACWAVSLTMIVPAMKDVPKANVSSLVKWTMTVSSDMSACLESVPWAAKRPPIVRPLNLAWATNVRTPALKNHADPMPNVRLWTKEPNAHACPDSYLTQQLLLDVLVNLPLVCQITNTYIMQDIELVKYLILPQHKLCSRVNTYYTLLCH